MGMRVLVVDADPDIRRLEQRILQFYGYEVITAAEDGEALADIADATPDLVVTDLPLLRRHGLELEAALAACLPTRPALLVSASKDEAPHGCCLLRRPFGVDDLLRAVGAALRATTG
jgi:two-component system, OmpR family, response regulator MprA